MGQSDSRIKSIVWGLSSEAIMFYNPFLTVFRNPIHEATTFYGSLPTVVFTCCQCGAENKAPPEHIPENILSEMKTEYYNSGGELFE